MNRDFDAHFSTHSGQGIYKVMYYTGSSLEDHRSNFILFLVMEMFRLLLSNHFVCVL